MTHTIAPDAARRRAPLRSVVVSGVGNVLEWYEWTAYAVFAPFIAAAVFNADDPVSSLLSTLAVFAVGFLMRPLGGVFFGRLADRRGRKFVLIATMLMMAGGSLAIGLMPTYDSIGTWASVLLLALRLIQGFAHGGESATVAVYITEMSTPQRRGMWGSFTFVAVFGGAVIAYLTGATVTGALDATAVSNWAWRIPFLLGGAFAVVVLILRRQMDESEVFEEHAAGVSSGTTTAPPVSRRQLIRGILLCFALMSGISAAHYTWLSYASTYAIVQKGMDANSAFWMSLIATVIATVAVPWFGLLSDKIGRRPMLITFGVGIVVLQFPLMTLISDRPWTLLVAATVGLMIVCAGSCVSAAMPEILPTPIRAMALGIGFSSASAIFGGSAPYVNQLLNSLDVPWAANFYIMSLALLTAFTAWRLIPETKGIDLAAAGRDDTAARQRGVAVVLAENRAYMPG
ncbi:MFS transporter [Rhodococcus sp. MSC1_016]|jgi:MHS family alpha-ketoglutarate permease-like MFS transporter|uniref:MFS transporter n=1 Tax=Rhodococcus sp. MSC1_016 TaxID=2909266 RepID=UPI002030865C|nr:MFS transporter [Rhodococcus sp. MSC1_016]